MYELINVLGNTYYINSPVKMGVYVDGAEAYLIDSGNDKEAGKKVIKILEGEGWNLKAVINTHSHADHIGGNKLLQNRTGCKIYTNGVESAITKYPILEPSMLYGGYPCKAHRNKFLMAEASNALDIAELDMPCGMEIFSLKGHIFDMIGVRTPDNVCFIADCISGANIIEKYHVGYLYNVAEYLTTLDEVEKMEAEAFVPAHAEIFSKAEGNSSELKKLIEINRQNVYEVSNLLLRICSKARGFDEILKAVFENYGLVMDMGQNILVGSTIKSFLSYLVDAGKVETLIIENILCWQTKA